MNPPSNSKKPYFLQLLSRGNLESKHSALETTEAELDLKNNELELPELKNWRSNTGINGQKKEIETSNSNLNVCNQELEVLNKGLTTLTKDLESSNAMLTRTKELEAPNTKLMLQITTAQKKAYSDLTVESDAKMKKLKASNTQY
ncbi:hypothetical protein Glove_228g78 [Diversispora epigaea]|uniref:Uncharacterized protein n=1 Tax=Diversispora epigaea TaxID=1348612 RepID=A0A397IDU8_9GLOM|nr:hypothetical protein Glove_228g78 [Diversispora epigaea]